jgi:hypothetical protein
MQVEFSGLTKTPHSIFLQHKYLSTLKSLALCFGFLTITTFMRWIFREKTKNEFDEEDRG